MSQTLAAAITKAASRQTYYTFRLLGDRERVEDAYRAYAYFRWVDDTLDAPSDPALGEDARVEQSRFLERQQSLLAACLRGEPPHDTSPHEGLLVELVRDGGPDAAGLHAYLLNMMRVMEFDAARRGRLIWQAELTEYTGWLAIAVTENLHYVIGHGAFAPHDETRYLAVTGAHIVHMLRDTFDDLRLGYYNVPREILEAGGIGPHDVHSEAYRAWVERRVRLARACFDAGRSYFARVRSARHRLAGLAYIARFEWLIETLEREGFRLRPHYADRKSFGAGLRMSWLILSSMLSAPGSVTVSPAIAVSGDAGR
ncbi:MAG TPA: squalene/phytoene synthase family protein [Chloroflexota bacterium]|nr:squalene/phytoene synthase family protein [Chloroflexota bacterium]